MRYYSDTLGKHRHEQRHICLSLSVAGGEEENENKDNWSDLNYNWSNEKKQLPKSIDSDAVNYFAPKFIFKEKKSVLFFKQTTITHDMLRDF